jgi:hypothetical protein
MASLAGREVANTYKDILHVYNGTENQGLEVTTKRVFDGEGVGSPLYLGTDFVEVGTSNNADNSNFKIWGDGTGSDQPYFLFNTSDGNVSLENGDLSVSGTITSGTIALEAENGSSTNAFTIDNSGNLQTTIPIESSNTITTTATIKVGTGDNEMKISGSNGRLSKGADKGNIELKDTSVSLQKNGVNLFEAKENGVLEPRTISALDPLPSSPSTGSMAVKVNAITSDAEFFIFT